jgi:hypothetical protein
MKKKIFAIAAIAIMVTASVCVYLSVQDNSPDKIDYALGSDMFKDYRAELGDSVSLGIVNDTSLNAQPAMLDIGRPDVLGSGSSRGNEDNKKNRLVGIDEKENMFEIVFKKIVVSNDGRPDVIMQDDFNAQIDKLYVTKDFIYFNLITHDSYRCENPYYPFSRDYLLEMYDQSYYTSDGKNSESFVISRQNNQIYSLAELPHIEYIDENIVWSINNGRSTVYLLTIEEGQLVLTDLVPNANISIEQCMVNKDGIIFIKNDTINETVNNIVYFISAADYKFDWYFDMMLKGSDGNVYIACGAQMFDTETMSWIVTDLSNNVTLRCSIFQSFLKNDGIYTIQYSYHGYSIGTFYLDDDGQYYFAYNYFDTKAVCFIGENVLCLDAGRVYVYYTTSGECNVKAYLGIENIKRIELRGNTLMAFEERIDGTVTYEIYTDQNGVVDYALISEVIYDTNIIVIKPLFGI